MYNNSMQAHDYTCDISLVHSQWLKAYNVVHSPPLTNMLKFSGCASTTSCTYAARICCVWHMSYFHNNNMLNIPHCVQCGDCIQLHAHDCPYPRTCRSHESTYAYTECTTHWSCMQLTHVVDCAPYVQSWVWSTLTHACAGSAQTSQCVFTCQLVHGIVQFTMYYTSRCTFHRAPNQHINRGIHQSQPTYTVSHILRVHFVNINWWCCGCIPSSTWTCVHAAAQHMRTHV